MSAFAIELEKELQSLDPEDALHIERALREMLELARRKNGVQHSAPQAVPYRTEARALGLRSGLSYDKWTELLDAAEGPDWK